MKQSPERSLVPSITPLRKRKDNEKVILRYHIKLFFGRKNIFFCACTLKCGHRLLFIPRNSYLYKA